jgi:exodeoxyribonuclease VII large subunit
VIRNPILRRPERMLDAARQNLMNLRAQLQATLPRTAKAESERLTALTRQFQAALPRRLKNGTDKLAAAARQLQAVGPLNVLERGYSYTLGPDGKVLRSPGQVTPGDRITSVLAEGKVASEVVGSSNETLRPRKVKPRKMEKHEAGPTLFGEPT